MRWILVEDSSGGPSRDSGAAVAPAEEGWWERAAAAADYTPEKQSLVSLLYTQKLPATNDLPLTQHPTHTHKPVVQPEALQTLSH